MKLLQHTLVAAGAMMIATSSALATSVGINTNPAGSAWDRNDPNTAYAEWDSYADFLFTNDSPDSSSGVTNPFLSQSTAITAGAQAQGAGLWDSLGSMSGVAGDDIIHPGPLLLNFSFTGTTSFEIKELYLQVKRATSTSSLESAIVPTLNGLAANAVSFTSGSGDTTSTSGNWSVTTWRWDAALVGQNLTNINLFMNFTAGHRAIDGIVIDASAVPEPAMLGWIGAGALLAIRRRV